LSCKDQSIWGTLKQASFFCKFVTQYSECHGRRFCILPNVTGEHESVKTKQIQLNWIQIQKKLLQNPLKFKYKSEYSIYKMARKVCVITIILRSLIVVGQILWHSEISTILWASYKPHSTILRMSRLEFFKKLSCDILNVVESCSVTLWILQNTFKKTNQYFTVPS